MKSFDNYEIHGCIEIDDPRGAYTEQCPDTDAKFWTLYGHLPEGGVEAIGDYKSRALTEEVYQRLTGRPFGSHEQNAATARAMTNATKLLESLKEVTRICEAMRYTTGLGRNQLERIERAKAVIADADRSTA